MIAEIDYKPYLPDTLKFLRRINDNDRWVIVKQGINRSVDLLSCGRSVLFFLAEETTVGGPHAVQAIYDPQEGVAFLETPEESTEQKGRFPTVLHAIEMIANVTKLVNQRTELPYPQVRFVDRLRGRVEELELALIPLNLITNRSNVLVFHPQARHVDPETLALAYYEATKADVQLPEDLIRHTMLVQALNGDRPSSKTEVTLRVLLTKETGKYRLMHPERIARWFTPHVNGGIILRQIA